MKKQESKWGNGREACTLTWLSEISRDFATWMNRTLIIRKSRRWCMKLERQHIKLSVWWTKQKRAGFSRDQGILAKKEKDGMRSLGAIWCRWVASKKTTKNIGEPESRETQARETKKCKWESLRDGWYQHVANKHNHVLTSLHKNKHDHVLKLT